MHYGIVTRRRDDKVDMVDAGEPSRFICFCDSLSSPTISTPLFILLLLFSCSIIYWLVVGVDRCFDRWIATSVRLFYFCTYN